MANTHPKHDIYIGPGRMVQGSLTDIQKTDPVTKKEQPEDKWRKFFAIAVPKGTINPQTGQPICQEINQLMMNTAWQCYQHVPNVKTEIEKGFAAANGEFAWKVEDGDHPSNAGKEGFAGCWIYKFQTSLLDLPKTAWNNNVPCDPAAIKRGYWIDVKGNTQANGKTETKSAGLYLNPNWVRFCGYDQEITGGQSAEEAFGNAPAPTAGSATPVAPSGQPGGPGAAPAVPNAGAAPQLTPPPGAAPQPPSVGAPAVPGVGANVTPPTAGAPAVPGAPGVTPPAVTPPSVSPSPGNASLSNPPNVTPQPGFANGPTPPPVAAPQPPAPPPPPPAAAVKCNALQIAEYYQVPHHPGWCWNAAANQYVADATSV